MKNLDTSIIALADLMQQWEIKKEDWLLTGQYTYQLLGYTGVPIRKGHHNIIINTSALPWKTDKDLLEVHPPMRSTYAKHYKKYLIKTDFDFDIILADKDTYSKRRNVVPFTLSNGETIYIHTPLGQLEELRLILSQANEKGWGKDKGKRILRFINDLIIILAARGESELVKAHKKVYSNYSFLLEEDEPTLMTNGLLKGISASPGTVTGKVRIINHEKEFSLLQEGEILVSKNTSAKFSLILARTKAIITDEGGMLSHTAIVAREMKIPCLVGTQNATKILKDGDLVEVDANNGIVKLLKTSS